MNAVGLMDAVEARLGRAGLPATTSELVRVSFQGVEAVDDLLEHGVAGHGTGESEAAPSAPVGAYITALEVGGDSAEAQLAGLYVFNNPSTHRTQRESVAFQAKLRRDGNRWRIASLR